MMNGIHITQLIKIKQRTDRTVSLKEKKKFKDFFEKKKKKIKSNQITLL